MPPGPRQSSLVLRSLVLFTIYTNVVAWGDVQPTLPPMDNGGAVNPPAGATALRYRWQPEREYPYHFTIDVDLGASVSRTEGYCIYRLASVAPSRRLSPKEPDQGTATAFVVHSDGVLATCQHVVSQARSVAVVIAGKSWPARVIAADAASDLALLQIEAKDLKPVSIANSDEARISETIRALGFPLSTILGTTLKVTTGTIAGRNSIGGHQILQVDAAINPGNSGGPVVNERGEVVGVASAKLSDRLATNVGFVQPINELRELLARRKIKPIESQAEQPIDGPSIVAKLTPSVHLVQVAVGPSDDRVALQYDASSTNRQWPKQMQPPAVHPRVPSRISGHRELEIDEHGFVVSPTNEEPLPCFLGQPELLALQPLSVNGQPQWSQRSQTVVTHIDRPVSAPQQWFNGRRPIPDLFLGFGQPPKVTRTPVIESQDFTLEASEADAIVVQKKHELRSLHDDAATKIALVGAGKWHFDPKDSIFTSAKMDYRLTSNIGERTNQETIQLTLNRIDAVTLAEVRRRSAERLAEYQRDQFSKDSAKLDELAMPKLAKLVQRIPLKDESIQALGITPDGKAVLLGGSKSLRRFSLEKPDIDDVLHDADRFYRTIAISPDSKFAVVATHHRVLGIQLVNRAVAFERMDSQVVTIDFLPQQDWVVLGRQNGQIMVIQMTDGKIVHQWTARSSRIVTLGTLPTKNVVVTIDERAIDRFELTTGKHLGSLARPEPAAKRYNGGIVACDAATAVLKTSDDLAIFTLDDSQPPVTVPIRSRQTENGSLAITPDGKRIVVADDSKRTIVYDFARQQIIDHWVTDTISSKFVAISANGSKIVTLGSNRILQCWEMPAVGE